MKRVVIMITIMFVSGAVMAQQDSDQTSTGINAVDLDTTGDGNINIVDQEINQQQYNDQVNNHNTIESLSPSSSSKSSSNNSLANVGNASVTVEGDDFPASTASAPSINPTSPCMGSSAAGGQGMSFGISVGSSWRDKECEKREAFRMGMESGHPEVTALALEVYRSLEAVQEAVNFGQPADQAQAERTGSAYNNALAGVRRTRP